MAAMGWITCLAVSENARIVPLEGVIEQIATQRFEQFFLATAWFILLFRSIEAVVESKGLWVLAAKKEDYKS